MNGLIKKSLDEYHRLIINDYVSINLNYLGEKLKNHKAENKRLLIFGNGAAASIASHASLDFTKQGKLETHCFHDPALLTAYSNDFGYENAYKEIINSYYKPNDIVIFFSVSGESPNIISALKKAKELGLYTVGFSGRKKDNKLAKNSELSFWVDSHSYNIVENIHSIWITMIIDYIVGDIIYEVT